MVAACQLLETEWNIPIPSNANAAKRKGRHCVVLIAIHVKQNGQSCIEIVWSSIWYCGNILSIIHITLPIFYLTLNLIHTSNPDNRKSTQSLCSHCVKGEAWHPMH